MWQAHDSGFEGLWSGEIEGLAADLTFEDVRYIRNSDNEVRWILEARIARLYQDRNTMNLEGIMIYFFPRGDEKVEIAADSGNYDINGGEITLDGNVEVRSANGQTLTSPTLHFSQGKDLIWTDDSVLITGQGMEMKGDGLEYDLSQGKLTVTGQTSVLPEGGELRF
jgi:LPS export ABC transporter protein LptC